MKKNASAWGSIKLSLSMLAGFYVLAYGFQITKINLIEFRDIDRAVSRVRVTRAIARPNIMEYEQEEFFVSTAIYVPCNPEGEPLPETDRSTAYLVVTPLCIGPGEEVTVEGFDFPPNLEVPLSFNASSEADPEKYVGLRTIRVRADANGYFSTAFEVPERPADHYQFLRATVRENVGSPKFTAVSILTFEKIVETIFMALVATVFGTALAIPVSFIAARNVMKDVRNPLTSIALGVLGGLGGIAMGLAAASKLGQGTMDLLSVEAANFSVKIAQIVLVSLSIWGLFRWMSRIKQPGIQSVTKRLFQVLLQLVLLGLSVILLYLTADLGIAIGRLGLDAHPALAVLGNLVYQSSDILTVISPGLAALVMGGIVGGLFSRIGQSISEQVPAPAVRTINIVAAGLAGASLMVLLGWVVDWLYMINNPVRTLWVPGGVGAAIGIGLALISSAKQPLPIGMVIYFITRTILNTMRSIEVIVWAIVFVVWVGIGPFAGVMALAVHTLAALGKLFSEQVENIMPGPIEAVTATGATRLQTIIYAIVPQILPPYISFTMYRWDINVRMSTIIGFVGGGGIGAVLFQNLQMLNYRDASVQMLAITIVVGTMDYFSSVWREKFV